MSRRRRHRPIMAALAACLAASGCSFRLENQVRYAGTLGGCAEGSGGTNQASLVRVADRFSFAPQDGALVLSGPVTADGTFSGSLAPAASRHDGTTRPDARQPSVVLTVQGRLDNDVAAGVYATPRCRTEFRLPRIRPGLLP